MYKHISLYTYTYILRGRERCVYTSVCIFIRYMHKVINRFIEKYSLQCISCIYVIKNQIFQYVYIYVYECICIYTCIYFFIRTWSHEAIQAWFDRIFVLQKFTYVCMYLSISIHTYVWCSCFFNFKLNCIKKLNKIRKSNFLSYYFLM
jgi:hypothetical protein